LDRVSTVVVGPDGNGEAGIFADYSQWEAWRSEPPLEKPVAKEKPSPAAAPQPRTKLPYIQQREWDGMEHKILQAEQELAACDREVQDSASDAKRLPEAYAKLQAAQARVEELYARWAELEAMLY